MFLSEYNQSKPWFKKHEKRFHYSKAKTSNALSVSTDTGLSKRFRVTKDTKKVRGGPIKHKKHLTLDHSHLVFNRTLF